MGLIAIDLDGTLLRSDQTISPRTIDILGQGRSHGWKVVPVTARPPRFLHTIPFMPEIFDLAICCNGALIYDVDAEVILEHASLSPHDARGIALQLRDRLPGVCFAAEMGLRYGWDAAYADLRGALLDPGGYSDDIERLIREPVTKLIVRHPEIEFEQLLDVTLSLGLTGCEITYSTSDFIEISRQGVNKATALERTVEQLGFSRADVVAFGDMPNDLPMLRWAGHNIAVANVHPEVLTAVDDVTASNDNDGVAIVLERLINVPDKFPRGSVPEIA